MEKLAKTISLHIVAEMLKINDEESTFEYNIAKNFDGPELIITPSDSNTIFNDAYFISEFSDSDKCSQFSRTFTINLIANLELFNTEDDDCEISIDDIGQIIITPCGALDPDSEFARFVDFKEEKVSHLEINEDLENSNPDSESANTEEDESEDEQPPSETDDKDIESISAHVTLEEDISSTLSKLNQITNNWTLCSGQIKTGFKEEFAEALNILSQHYAYVEDKGIHDNEYLLEFSNPVVQQLTESALELPFDIDAARELDVLMSKPQTKDKVMNRLKAIFFDDVLFDSILALEDDKDVRVVIKERLADLLDAYDKDRSDFKLEIDSNTRRILDKIISTDFKDQILEKVEDEPEIEWEITYDLPITESVDDEIEASDKPNTYIMNAPDVETALRYGEQYARILAKNNPKWNSAEIISIKKR